MRRGLRRGRQPRLFPRRLVRETVRYGGNPVFSNIFPYGPGTDEGTVIKQHGSTYLSEYGLPDYVNSDVVTVREVADKAYEAYTGAAARRRRSGTGRS